MSCKLHGHLRSQPWAPFPPHRRTCICRTSASRTDTPWPHSPNWCRSSCCCQRRCRVCKSGSCTLKVLVVHTYPTKCSCFLVRRANAQSMCSNQVQSSHMGLVVASGNSVRPRHSLVSVCVSTVARLLLSHRHTICHS